MTTEDFDFKTVTEDECFIVWRIEAFKAVLWKDIGAFHVGDSYLVLHGYKKGTSSRILHDIYYWIGSESTQDEYTTAAYKAVELDDRFDGEPIQHRETEGNESKKFLELFDKYGGVRYLQGGIASGFREINEETENILYHVKGRRNPVVKQVPCSGKSLNLGDVFILSSHGKFFLWFGPKANPMEKMKGNHAVDLLKSKHPKWAIIRLDDGDTTPEFWEALGGQCEIASAEEGGSDIKSDYENIIKMFEVKDTELIPIAEGAAAKKSLLNGPKVILIHKGDQLVAWIGENAPRENSKNAMKVAITYMEENHLPRDTIVAEAKEGRVSDLLDIIFV